MTCRRKERARELGLRAADRTRQHGGRQILVMPVHLLPGRGLMDPAPAWYAIGINGHLGAVVLSALPALVPQPRGVNTVLTGLLDRSALYGVLAEIEALGLDLIEAPISGRNTNHKNQVTAAHRDGR